MVEIILEIMEKKEGYDSTPENADENINDENVNRVTRQRTAKSSLRKYSLKCKMAAKKQPVPVRAAIRNGRGGGGSSGGRPARPRREDFGRRALTADEGAVNGAAIPLGRVLACARVNACVRACVRE